MKYSKILALIPLFLTLFSAGPLQGQAQTETSEYEKRLTKIREEIESLKGKIGEEEKKEQTTLSSLDKIGFTKSLIKNELALLTIQLEKNRLELSAIKKNIPELKAYIEQEKQDLAKILVSLYKFGRFSFVRFALETRELLSLLGESKNLAFLASFQERTIGDYAKNIAELGQAAEVLKAKERQIAALIQKTSEKKRELDAEANKAKAVIDQIRTNKKTYEQTLEELSFRAQELQKLMQKFEKQESTFPFPLVPLYEKKGQLPWPVNGKVKQSFGVQKHPQFNTITMNNGVEIAPPKDNLSIRSIHPGKVVFADHFPGYGNLLIIDHGISYYSLYGHCAEFLVKTGDVVQSEQPIALAGDTGSLVGISLYFEIRLKTKPVNPLQWLLRR